MKVALCHDSVVPARGGCETYVADLARRLHADGHAVHLYTAEFDAEALPGGTVIRALPRPRGPRFLRPWRFAAACARALADGDHDVSVGFVKTWGQDVLVPQGGLHLASADYNLGKYRSPLGRWLARGLKGLDLAHWSYWLLERRQYLGPRPPLIVAPSRLVQGHFRAYYGLAAECIRVVPNAIDPGRFPQEDRLATRHALRQELGIPPETPVGLFVGHNYRLKGLEPLLRAVARLPGEVPFRLLACGSARTGPYARLARRLGVAGRVHLLGFRPDVAPCFFAADFLVHPTFYDPCSLVVLEALACGLPVLTTRHNGAAELLHPPQDGLVLADPHDAGALAQGILQLCAAEGRAQRAAAARRAAAGWTFEDHYRALLGVLREAARRRRVA